MTARHYNSHVMEESVIMHSCRSLKTNDNVIFLLCISFNYKCFHLYTASSNEGHTGGLSHGSQANQITDHGYHNFIFLNHENV